MHLYPVPQNLLLRPLARRNNRFADGKLRLLAFEPGQQLWQAGEDAPFALFPVRGVLSLQLSPGGGRSVEAAMVGREGFAGVGQFPGADRTCTAAVAISAGEALVMTKDVFRRAIAIGAFRAAVERYTRVFMSILSQLVVCNRVHVIEKICVGHLLQIHDRTGSDSLYLTQEIFARRLGVRRASISRAVNGLRRAGAIDYDRRGSLSIRDRRQLERLSCPCYSRVKSEFDRLVEQHGGL